MKRSIRIEGDVAYVPLTRGYEAMVDAADVPLVDTGLWSALIQGRNVYAAKGVGPRSLHRTIAMHRLLLPPSGGLVVDHIDGNGLNNRRANLRLVTRAQNNMNRRSAASRNKSGFKGVWWNKKASKWESSIKAYGVKKHLGVFVAIEDAVAAYNAASMEMHGEFGAPSGGFVAAVIDADPNAMKILGRRT